MQVVSIHQPNAETVEMLRDLLRQAEAGELQSLIYSAVCAGGQIACGYTAIANGYKTIGQLARMQYLLQRELDETSTRTL